MRVGMSSPVTADALNRVTSAILDAAITVHRALGPGLLERAYVLCLAHELRKRLLRVETQKPVPLVYGSVRIDCAYRVDLVVEERVLVEVKALDAVASIHVRQLQTYLRLSGSPVGLLLNFGAETMKAGITRVVNRFPAE